VSLFHLGVPGPSGLETAVGVVAVLPVVASAYRLLRSSTRRRVLAVAGGVIAVLVVVGAAGAAGSLLGVRPVEDAVAATRRAVAAAQDGDGAKAAAEFRRARAAFEDAEGSAGAWWTMGGRIVPVLGTNLRAVQHTVALGADLTRSGATLSSEVDFDRVQRPDGGVDLATLASFRRPVGSSARVLERAEGVLDELDSPWLLAPLRSRLSELGGEVEDLRSQSDAAELGIEHLPAMLGADGPRRYLFLLGNPAELRDLGGHLGNWAEVVVDNGRVHRETVGGPRDLEVEGGAPDAGLRADFPASLVEMNPVRFPHNWGASPDLPTVTRLASQLFHERTGRQIDGVVYADTEAFAALLALTGPVDVPNAPQPMRLDSSNASDFLTRGQYVTFPDDRIGDPAVQDVIQHVLDRVGSTALPGPRRLSELFWPLTHDGHFQMDTLHEEDRPLLERFGLRGAVPAPNGGDLLGVLNRNAGPNKIDSFLRREVVTDVVWDPSDGHVQSTVRVTLHNDAPAEGLPQVVIGNKAGYAPGTNVTDIVVLTPFQLKSVNVSGVVTPSHPLLEGKLWRHSVRVAVPAGGSTTAIFQLQGQVAAGNRYRMDYVGQPLVNDSDVKVTVTATSGETRLQGKGPGAEAPATADLDGEADTSTSWRLLR